MRAMINNVEPIGKNHKFERDVVVMPTLNVDGVVALRLTLAGTVQTAPLGAPEQESVAEPLMPAPPMEREYEALAPPATVTEVAPPGAAPRPMPGGVDGGVPGGLVEV